VFIRPAPSSSASFETRCLADETVQSHVDRVAAELLRRQRARVSLIDYALAIDIPGAPAREGADLVDDAFLPIESKVALHHRVIMSKIQTCMETHGGRLMILAPPGSAKSTYGSVIAPTWAMGKWPGHRIIIASYASDIATKQSKKARAVCRQAAYSSIWADRPVLNDESKAADQWSLTNFSELMSAGILAGITGNRANGIIIDDPFSNREAADSPTIRSKVYDEYVDTALTRLLPGGYVILINTRWHEEDLSGSILPEDYKGQSGPVLCRDGQTWEVLCIPAEAEHADDPLGRKYGEFLWPEWFPRTHWDIWRNNPRAIRTWSALYQQRPSPGEGLQFKREDARWYDPDKRPGLGEDDPPLAMRMYGASDYAVTPDGGDFTEHGIVGLDHRGRMYFVDWWSGQKESDKSIEAFINKVGQHKPTRWFNEGGPIDKAIKPAINRAMRESKKYVSIETIPSINSKDIRLESFHARWAAHQVYLPKGRPWALRLVEQLASFPVGRYDDMADVCGLFGRGVDTMADAALPVEEEKPSLVPFSAEWVEWEGDDEKPKVRYVS
jgi:predicted phage terminase large subunit-like protein